MIQPKIIEETIYITSLVMGEREVKLCASLQLLYFSKMHLLFSSSNRDLLSACLSGMCFRWLRTMMSILVGCGVK
uniref:Uncharacterized protein n=1 Tax=Arundo donax TaxID=35708 RepID=A0A0A8ZHN1_ARUDO